MTKVVFGFHYLLNEPMVIRSGMVTNRHTPQSLTKLQSDSLNVEQQRLCSLFGDIWAKFEGHDSSTLNFGEILIKRNTANSVLVEIHYTIEHGIHSMTLSMYTKMIHSKHFPLVFANQTDALIFNSYLVVEASSKKSFGLLPMMTRLAL